MRVGATADRVLHQLRSGVESTSWPQRLVGVIAVGPPVTRRPPHGSRRAVFPHRALQKDSLPQKASSPSSLLPSVRLAWLLRHGRPDQVSCMGCVFLSAPSPCARPYRL